MSAGGARFIVLDRSRHSEIAWNCRRLGVAEALVY
jgi:hypothetical protein